MANVLQYMWSNKGFRAAAVLFILGLMGWEAVIIPAADRSEMFMGLYITGLLALLGVEGALALRDVLKK